MKKIFLILVISILLTSCISLNKKSVCQDIAKDCYICQIATKLNTTPEDVANVIKIANIIAISKNKYTASQALDKLKEIRLKLNTPISYLFIKNTIQTIKSKYPEIFLISVIYLNEFNSVEIMNKTDQDLIIKWIDSLILDMEFLSNI